MGNLGRNFVLALCLGVAVYLVLAVLTGFEDLQEAFGQFRWSLIPAILGLVFTSYIGRFVRWLYYLRVLGVTVPPKENVAIFAAGLSMTISPGKLGEVLKSVFVRQVAGAPVARTAPTVIAERVTDGTGMILWGLLGALAFSFGPGILLAFLALTIFGIAVLRSKKLSLLAERTISKVPFLNRFAPYLGDFHGATSELLGVRALIVGTVVSFISWGFEITAVYLCVVGIGVEVPFLMVVFIFAVASIVGVASMLPGGIGPAEAGLAGQFIALAGLASGPAAALTIVIRLATLWFAIVLGIAGLLALRVLLGKVETEPAGGDQ
jgi:uncharacterized protein (TIRG00374 family)